MRYKSYTIEDSNITTSRRDERTGAIKKGASPLYQIRNADGDIVHRAGTGEFLTSIRQAKAYINRMLEIGQYRRQV